jgi:hypothetical protein
VTPQGLPRVELVLRGQVLLLAKLPDVLDAGQKANKVKNLLQDMRRAGLVHPEGPRSTAIWRRGPGG